MSVMARPTREPASRDFLRGKREWESFGSERLQGCLLLRKTPFDELAFEFRQSAVQQAPIAVGVVAVRTDGQSSH